MTKIEQEMISYVDACVRREEEEVHQRVHYLAAQLALGWDLHFTLFLHEPLESLGKTHR